MENKTAPVTLECTATRTYKVALMLSDLEAVKRMVGRAAYLDSHIEADLVDAVTRCADYRHLTGELFLCKDGSEYRWEFGSANGAVYGVVRYEAEETDSDYEVA